MEPCVFECSEKERDTYMEGLCHALAIALSRRLGTPMVAIWGIEGGADCLAHVAVQHPGDPPCIIDVRGILSLESACCFYHDLDERWTEHASEEDVSRWSEAEDRLVTLDEQDVRSADALAQRILAHLGIPTRKSPARI